MQSVRFALFLTCLLLMYTTVNAAQPIINMIKISKCAQIIMELISDLSKKIVPGISKLITCVDYRPELNIRSVTSGQMLVLIYQFFQQATKGDCLLNLYSSLSATMAPHLKRRKQLKCAYMFIKEPLC